MQEQGLCCSSHRHGNASSMLCRCSGSYESFPRLMALSTKQQAFSSQRSYVGKQTLSEAGISAGVHSSGESSV